MNVCILGITASMILVDACIHDVCMYVLVYACIDVYAPAFNGQYAVCGKCIIVCVCV